MADYFTEERLWAMVAKDAKEYKRSLLCKFGAHRWMWEELWPYSVCERCGETKHGKPKWGLK